VHLIWWSRSFSNTVLKKQSKRPHHLYSGTGHKLISHPSSMVGIIRKIPDFICINSGRVTEIDMTHA
jgi:hypothetical protein